MTVVPLASTAAISTLSVPVWLGYSRTTRLPTRRGTDGHRGLDPGLDVAVGRVERGAHRLEGPQVHVDGPGTEVVAPGQGHPGPAAAGRGAGRGPPPTPASSPPARRAPRGPRRPGWSPPARRGVRPGCTSTPMAPSSSPMMSTSVIRGTLVSTWRPSASRQAAISLSTEFLAPPARTVPDRGPLGVTTNRSTPPVWPAGDRGSFDGAGLPAPRRAAFVRCPSRSARSVPTSGPAPAAALEHGQRPEQG